MAASCSTCFYFRAPIGQDAESGLCRRAPPVNLAGSGGLWPPVKPTDWCGGFSASDPAIYAGSTTGPTGLQGLQGFTGIGFDAKCVTYADTLTTTDIATHVIRSVPVPINSIVYIEAIISGVASIFLTGAYGFLIGAFGRAGGNVLQMGVPNLITAYSLTGVPAMTLVANVLTQTVDVTIKGNGVSVTWSSLILARTN